MPLERSRILLADMPRMRREIITDILAGHADMAIVGDAQLAEPIAEAVVRTGADVVVIDRDDAVGAMQLLADSPHLKVLAVGGDGRESWLYELRPYRVELGELTPAKLVDAIRSRARLG